MSKDKKNGGKKYLRKNEVRMDNNPKHFGKAGKPHPALISGRLGKKFRANDITHSRFANDEATFDIPENPDKRNTGKVDNRKTRLSVPFWQNVNMFGKEKLTNFHFSNESQKIIRKENRKYEKKKK